MSYETLVIASKKQIIAVLCLEKREKKHSERLLETLQNGIWLMCVGAVLPDLSVSKALKVSCSSPKCSHTATVVHVSMSGRQWRWENVTTDWLWRHTSCHSVHLAEMCNTNWWKSGIPVWSDIWLNNKSVYKFLHGPNPSCWTSGFRSNPTRILGVWHGVGVWLCSVRGKRKYEWNFLQATHVN